MHSSMDSCTLELHMDWLPCSDTADQHLPFDQLRPMIQDLMHQQIQLLDQVVALLAYQLRFGTQFAAAERSQQYVVHRMFGMGFD